MKYKQWEEILSAVNNEGGNLNENNVIEKIKERLKVKDKDEYEKWERVDFDINYRFECGGYKRTLLFMAGSQNKKDVLKFLCKAKRIDVDAKDKYGKPPCDYTGKFLKKVEEKNKLPQDKDDNKGTTRLLGKTEKKQPTSAAMKGFFVGGSVAVLGAAIAVTFFSNWNNCG
ncbi:ankyrin repeat domain-containing protein [Wolbachia endosymbiont of Oedothorax gibbosus]|uniref:hypothetical protein n=1 Tax=Wolbachia endosymbiont of Oedothorax gibbosus TaxID=931100 RepID=UPI002023D10F|nr:hypothetical protein [Wolbachia endosymbiont of Oedothorax gibbosus]